MDSSAIPVFLAGPFPVLNTARFNEPETAIQLDVGLLIGGVPTMLARTDFPFDETWERIEDALDSGDARLGVAGIPHEAESAIGTREVYPSAFVGLECANGERLVLAHIRGADSDQAADDYARRVIKGILRGCTPTDLGEPITD